MGEPLVENFVDKAYWMTHVEPDRASENGVLFQLERIYLHCLRSDFPVHNYQYSFASDHACGNLGNGLYKQTPWGQGRDRASHDNATAIASIMAITGRNNLAPKIFGQYWHPRDIGYFLFLRGNPILIWFTYLTMIWSCLRVHKTRNGVKFIATDSKLLAWVRLRTIEFLGTGGLGFRLTNSICNKIINKNFGSWRGVFWTYFQHPLHPIRKLAAEVYPTE